MNAMGELLRAKRDLEKLTGPVNVETGQFLAVNPAHRGEVHGFAIRCGDDIIGTGHFELDAVMDASIRLATHATKLIGEYLREYDEGERQDAS